MYESALPPANEARTTLRRFLPLAMVLFVFSIHGSSLFNPFFFSDLNRVQGNPAITQSDGWQITLGLAERPAGYPGNIYRPATELSFWLNAQLTGVNPFGFRLVNLVLLALMGWCIAAWLQGYVHTAPAWFIAALAVSHPTLAETMNMIVGRADLLAMIGVFGFAAIQHRALEKHWNVARITGALLLALLALTAKETGLLVALIAITQPLVRLPQNDQKHEPHTAAIHRLNWIAPLSIVLLVGVAYALARWDSIGSALLPQPTEQDLTTNPLRGASFAERWFPGIALSWHYLKQVFWTQTSFNQTPWPLPGADDWRVWAGVAVWVGVIGLTLRWAVKRSWLLVPGVVLIGHLLLVTHVIVALGPYASNRLALPVIVSVLAVVAYLFDRISEASRRKRALVLIPGGILLIAVIIQLAQAHRGWDSMPQRVSADYNADPQNPITQYRLGKALIVHRGADEALGYLASASTTAPNSCEARLGFADALFVAGEFNAANTQYEALLDQYPDQQQALIRLAELNLLSGRTDKASRYVRRVQAQRPHDPEVMHLYARVLQEEGDTALALATYELLLTRHPGHPAQEDHRLLKERLDAQLQSLIEEPGNEPNPSPSQP